MPDFKLTTNSTFENVYIIEADTLDDAIELLMNQNNPPDFYQKHLGERIIKKCEVKDKDKAVIEIKKAGYF